MTDSQKQWLSEHPKFKVWSPHPWVTLKSWTDVGYLTPDGRVIPDGKHSGWGGLHLISTDDTLYVVPKGSTKVGREYDMV